MNKLSQKELNGRSRSPKSSSVGVNSPPCLLLRPLALHTGNDKGNNNNRAHDRGRPLPPLREQVHGKFESAVQTFTENTMMAGCELVDLGSSISNDRSNDRSRIDVDLGLIGLRPEHLLSRLFLIKPDLQLDASSAETMINPVTLLSSPAANVSHQAPYYDSMEISHQVHNNELQGNDEFYHTHRKRDLFASVEAVPPVANNISSCNDTNLPEYSCSLQYIDLDAFQAEMGLTRHSLHHHQQQVDANVDAASALRKVQQQTDATKKRKQNKALLKERNISCSQCPRKFRSAGYLKIHFNSAHPSDGTISKCRCNVCGKGFCHGGALALHKRRYACSLSTAVPAEPRSIMPSIQWQH
ncbi:uncharacterized protein LOC103315472 [Nasonia vitripennis]|uniref:C2H2-type domain-containing protein n=1 Tax=Nasonia vitripennis TaxID=7425 RepID=A0A7M7J1N9_NASVI|nr:uncharacterized protein LOC103315472 [Nasonia vitripennis]